jgi:hypothetical protein
MPQEVDVGASLALKVRLACASCCDLRGQSVQLLAADGAVISQSETGEFAVLAPGKAGEHDWSLVFPGHETDDLIHEKASSLISLRTIPQDEPDSMGCAVSCGCTRFVQGEGRRQVFGPLSDGGTTRRDSR